MASGGTQPPSNSSNADGLPINGGRSGTAKKTKKKKNQKKKKRENRPKNWCYWNQTYTKIIIRTEEYKG
jgi:hypothetical protein